jgi:peptidoglycan/LPS O-acetylase OafA/YrhL
VPCLPADDTAPAAAQLVATAALRTLSAAAGAVLLYRALVPRHHAWHWGGLARVLSLPFWRPLADLSFCSYLVHFRLLMELNFRAPTRRVLLGWQPDPLDGAGWLAYIPRLAVVGLGGALALALLLHRLVEKPIGSWLDPPCRAKAKAL